MAAQVRLLLSISNWRVLLKPCGQLLDDDLRAFAAGAPSPGAFLRGEMQNAVTTGISELLESDGEELNEDFAQALDEVRREREAFVAGLGEFLAECVTRFAPPASREGFEEYFERNAPAAAAMLAERAGVQIAARGGEAIFDTQERQDVGGRGDVTRVRSQPGGAGDARRGSQRGRARHQRRRGGGHVWSPPTRMRCRGSAGPQSTGCERRILKDS